MNKNELEDLDSFIFSTMVMCKSGVDPKPYEEWTKGFRLFSLDGYIAQGRNYIVDQIKKLFIPRWQSLNRLEIINHLESGEGREYTVFKKEDFNIELQIQDDGRTLKIFLSEKEDKNDSLSV